MELNPSNLALKPLWISLAKKTSYRWFLLVNTGTKWALVITQGKTCEEIIFFVRHQEYKASYLLTLCTETGRSMCIKLSY